MMIRRCDRCKEEFEMDVKPCTVTLTVYDKACVKLDLCKKCQKEIRDVIYKSTSRTKNTTKGD